MQWQLLAVGMVFCKVRILKNVEVPSISTSIGVSVLSLMAKQVLFLFVPPVINVTFELILIPKQSVLIIERLLLMLLVDPKF